MKRFVSLLISLAFVFCIFGTAALAAGSFDKSVFENSTKFTTDGFRDWNIQGRYKNAYTNATIEVYSLLFSDYVTEGWGPELRAYFYDPAMEMYCQVTAFRANINGTLYCFDSMGEGSDGSGYVFGGKVQEELFKALLNLKSAAFQFEYIDAVGDTHTVWDDHIHTGELSELVDMAKYLIKSNAFSIDPDPEESDAFYGAYIE